MSFEPNNTDVGVIRRNFPQNDNHDQQTIQNPGNLRARQVRPHIPNTGNSGRYQVLPPITVGEIVYATLFLAGVSVTLSGLINCQGARISLDTCPVDLRTAAVIMSIFAPIAIGLRCLGI